MVAKFRKKPVIVEALQWDPSTRESAAEMLDFLKGGSFQLSSNIGELTITTLEGTMTAQRGDWIIKGVAGEFYPCAPHIFEMTYEPVEEAL